VLQFLYTFHHSTFHLFSQLVPRRERSIPTLMGIPFQAEPRR
jgi:hypothetical protein